MSDTEAGKANAARATMETARVEVMECEKEIQTLKETLRRVGYPTDELEPSTFRITALKISGLPEAAKPTFKIQVSSPIEYLALSKIYDPLDPSADGSFAEISDVDTSTATLTVEVKDADIYLGSSEAYDVAPLCTFNARSPTKNITQIDVAIIADERVNETDASTPASQAITEANTSDSNDDMVVVDNVTTGANNFADETEDIPSSTIEEKADDKKDDQVNVIDDTPSSTSEEKADDKKDDQVTDIDDTPSSTSKEKVDDKKDDQVTDIDDTPSSTVGEKADEKKEDQITATDDQMSSEQKAEEENDEETSPATETAVESSPTSEPAKAASGVSKEAVLKSSDSTSEQPSAETKTSGISTSSVTIPLCVATFRVEYTPSKKEEKEALYKILNEASVRKTAAIEKLRKSAAAVSQAKQKTSTSITTTSSANKPAVKPGFLNKKPTKKQEPNIFMKLYNRSIGPNSMFRTVFPVAKNYLLFFGAVAFFHFKGHELALPAPV